MTADRSRCAWAVVLAACGSSPTIEPTDPATPAAPVAAVAAPAVFGCAPTLPAAACTAFEHAIAASWRADAPGLAACTAADPKSARVGEWRYALIAPLYAPIEAITAAELAAMTRGEHAITLAAPADARASLALGDPVGVLAARPRLDATHWAIVPADALEVGWQVVTVDGHHPLSSDGGPLVVPLCAPVTAVIRNIDPAKLTTLAMTGTTAPTRLLARLMDKKGATYPARDVASWFAGVDLVHVSNEVSFTKLCTTPGARGMAFCAREHYIELLEAIGADIIELTGSHLLDYGTTSLDHTLDMYAARGWRWFGGGRDQLDASRPLELEHHGNKIAFVGCNMPKTTSNVIRNGPNVAACDTARLDWQIRDLRRRGFVPIVSIQHEEVYVHDPPYVVVRDFRRFAESGAGVVFGSQAHCAHPWEIHYGAYVHYGAGNLFFDQEASNTRDGVADRLVFHAGRLLTIGHLYTRLEEFGRPRPLTDRERAGFLGRLTSALAKLPRATAAAAPAVVPVTPDRPDSFLVGSRLQPVLVFPPTNFDPTKTYPLVIALHARNLRGGPLARAKARGLAAVLATGTLANPAFVVAPHLASGGAWTPALIAAAKAFALAKFPIDPEQVTIRREK